MSETLEALHRLQTVERELVRLRRQREQKARRIARQKRQIQQTDEKLQQQRRLLVERQKRIDALQLEVSSREQAIDRHRQALNKAKTNREYASILATMNTEKADTAKLETEILRLMEEVQGLQDESAKIEEEKAQLLEGLARAEEALRKFDEDSRAEREELEAKRAQFVDTISPSTLQTFLRAADHHDGEAMASVERIHPKREEYICSGCNMKITLEVVNALYTRDEVQVCKICGRILYLAESLDRSHAKH